uniref:Amino acid transporter n=1 Tax=Cynoglossus semilaevis TaxID=244447 RepID=A0A3P8WD56_CYNSE
MVEGAVSAYTGEKREGVQQGTSAFEDVRDFCFPTDCLISRNMEEKQQSFQELSELDKTASPRSSSQTGSKVVVFLRRNAFVILTVVGVALGMALGSALRFAQLSARDIHYLTFPGELLLRVLQMVVLPLIVSSLISGMSSVDAKACGRIGLRAFCYYMLTSLIAGTTGIIMTVSIQPGKSSSITSTSSGVAGQPVESADAFLDLIRFTPVGMLFLVAGQVVKMTDVRKIGHEVVMYTITVVSGLMIHCFITLPLIYFAFTRKNPFILMSGALQALATFPLPPAGFTTSFTVFYCHLLGLPAGFTTSFTAFYCHLLGLEGSVCSNHFLFINLHFLIVTAVSTGTAGIPQAGIVSLLIVLSSLGLPTENISLLMIVDWMLERMRTSTNVLGDCIGVGVVQHLSRRDLQRSRSAEEDAQLQENSTENAGS